MNLPKAREFSLFAVVVISAICLFWFQTSLPLYQTKHLPQASLHSPNHWIDPLPLAAHGHPLDDFSIISSFELANKSDAGTRQCLTYEVGRVATCSIDIPTNWHRKDTLFTQSLCRRA